MDQMGAFLKGFHKAWPDDLEPFDEAHLSLTNDTIGEVVYRGPRLRAPFHRGLGVESFYGGADARVGERAARSLAALLRDHAGAVRRMSDAAERADTESRAAGARMVRYLPTCFHGDCPVPSMRIQCDVELIDDALARTTLRFDLDEYVRSTGWRLLRRELRAQAARRLQSGRGIEVDPVLAWHLAEMTETQLNALADLLAAKPVPGAADNANAYVPQWDRTRLERHGIPLPRTVAWIRVSSGRLVGKVHLGPTLTWNRGKLTATDQIPQTLSSSLPGRPLSSLARHPSLPEVGILSATLQRNGLTSVKVDIEDRMLPFPSGLRSLR